MVFTPRNPLKHPAAASPAVRRIAVALPLAVLIGYVVFWFTVVQTAESQVRQWIAAQQDRGLRIAHGEMQTGGFPFRVDIRIDRPAAKWSGGAWSGPALTLSGAPWDWRRIHWQAPGRHVLDWTARDGRARSATLDAAHLEGWGEAGPNGLPRIEAWLTDGALALPVGRLTARGLLIQVLPPRDGGAAAETGPGVGPRLPVSIDAKGVELPDALATALGRRIDRLALDMSLNGPVRAGPWPEPALAWRDAGGVLEVRQLGLAHGPLNMSGEGTLAIDPAGQPEGAFTARVSGFSETIEALRKQGIVDGTAADAVQIVLGLLAKGPPGGPKTLDVPISLQDRTVSLGAVKLFRLKPVDWFAPRGP